MAVVCSAGLQSCLDDNDKYYYVEGFPNALVTVKNATDGSFFLQLNDRKQVIEKLKTCFLPVKKE